MTKHTIRIAALVLALALVPAAAQARSKTKTLRFFDKEQSTVLTHADGTVVDHAPYPDVAPGDTLDVFSVDFAGNHRHHAKHWTASNHLHCVFGAGEPDCVSHVAIGGSQLIFRGNPGTVIGGTGRYLRATGRVVHAKEVPGGTDVVARVHLR
jgi:hypothetical protein